MEAMETALQVRENSREWLIQHPSLIVVPVLIFLIDGKDPECIVIRMHAILAFGRWKDNV